MMDISILADSPLRSGANQGRFLCSLTLIARSCAEASPSVFDRPSS